MESLSTSDLSLISNDTNSSTGPDYDELFSLLGLNIRDLSPEVDDLVTKMAKYKMATNLRSMDPMSVHCWYTDKLLERIDLAPQMLALKQNVENAEAELEKDKQELKEFKEELKLVKVKIDKEKITEGDFMKLKRSKESEIQTFEQTLNTLEKKIAKYHIPAEVLPKNIKCLENDLQRANKERNEIKNTAQNISQARSAKKDLLNLKNKDLKLQK